MFIALSFKVLKFSERYRLYLLIYVAMSKKKVQTPLMQQYAELKKKYPGALLLCKVGDFYEAFGEDAIKLSKLVGIVLTKRSNGSAASVELAGFPYHALDSYIPKLVKAGERVAICDQLENPQDAKGLIKRGLTELVTPGVTYHDHILDTKNNNYLAAIHFASPVVGIAFLDVSTGEFFTTQGDETYIERLVQNFAPAEIIFNKAVAKKFHDLFHDTYHYYMLESWVYKFEYAYERLNEQFSTTTLKGFGIEDLSMGIIAAGAILRYLEETEHRHLSHINAIARLQQEKYLWLDKFTICNLELITPQQEGGVSLLEILDKTSTPMGARMLRRWLLFPLKEVAPIQRRLHIVSLLCKNSSLAQRILSNLKQLGDLERLISKVTARRINPRQLLALKKSLYQTSCIQGLLTQSEHKELVELGRQLYGFDFLVKKMEATLQENPPIITSQGNLIKRGVNKELDEFYQIVFQTRGYLNDMLLKIRAATGIQSLKVGHNKIFGFYLEVTHTHKNKVPKDWIRKQTLVNAERYVTEDLKSYEEKILYSQEKMYSLEQHLYQELVAYIETFVSQVQHNAKILAELDCYHSFMLQAVDYNYACPTINEGDIIEIKSGRHPVIEHFLPLSKHYVPNDIYLDTTQQQIIILTGPNMAGKSAILRMTALCTLMAQIGSYIPASQASIGLVDKIFIRVGASDNLAMRESTFMVEMNETASILNNLSNNSLIIIDELGRGTGTSDGFSLAQGVVEYLHEHKKYRPKTLFATHYHNLNLLAEKLSRVKNFHVAVKEIKNQILFLYNLKPGSSQHSFGIQVAKMAGLPQAIIRRAEDILAHLIASGEQKKEEERIRTIPSSSSRITLMNEYAPLIALLNTIDTNAITPMEALLKLEELKKLL